MLETILISMLIVAICTVLLAVRILLKKDGRFPDMHVGDNPAMRKRGVKCVQAQDREARTKASPKIREFALNGQKK